MAQQTKSANDALARRPDGASIPWEALRALRDAAGQRTGHQGAGDIPGHRPGGGNVRNRDVGGELERDERDKSNEDIPGEPETSDDGDWYDDIREPTCPRDSFPTSDP